VGETFFKTDAAAGQNLYGCTATNVWTVEASADLPSGVAGQVLANSGSGAVWTGIAGDVTGPPGALSVVGLQGRHVLATAPSNGQTLRWNATSSQWEPAGPAANYSVAFTSQTSIVIPGTAHGYTTSNLLVQCYGTGSSIIIPSSVSIDGATYDVTIGFLSATSGRCLVNGGGSGISGGSGTGAGSGVLSTLGVALTSSTVLTIGAGCSTAAPCNVRFGTTVWSIQRPATATVTSGAGMAYIYVDQTGTVTVGHNLSVTCSTGCQAQTGIGSFPINTIPIATWIATNGSWDAQGGSDWRAWLSTKVLNAGQGIMVIDTGGASAVAVDATVVPTYFKGSASLGFPEISNGACAADQAISVPGAAPGDAVTPGWPVLLPGLFGTMLVSGTNTIAVRLCNLSGVTVYPAIAAYSATIIRSF
jgi:hypothetical protein